MNRSHAAAAARLLLPSVLTTLGVLGSVPCRCDTGASDNRVWDIARFVANADAVALCRIESVEIVSQPPRFIPPMMGNSTEAVALPGFDGICNLRILQCLKGQVGVPEVEIRSAWPPSPANDPRERYLDRTVLAFLQRQANGHWQLSKGRECLWLIPDDLGNKHEAGATDLQRVTRLILDAAQVPGYEWHLSMLIHSRQPRIADDVRPIAHTADLLLRDMVLSIMIENGAYDAIPEALALNHAPGQNPLGVLSLQAIARVRTEDVIPYYNRLLFNWDVNLRKAGVYGLRDMDLRTDQSSIPYLALTVNDPDVDVAYQAYSQLSKRVPELGAPDVIPYWLSHRQAEIERLQAWWKDEMGGKHNNVPSAAEQAALIRTLGAAGKAGASRNPAEVALFSPAVTVRKAALTLLGESPSVDDIPYLELTLRDPDPGVDYSAYTLRWRLLHLPGTAVPLAHFRTHWQQDSDPERHWWWDELKGDHITDENLRRRVGLGPLKPPPVTEIHAGPASGPGSPRDPQADGHLPGKP